MQKENLGSNINHTTGSIFFFTCIYAEALISSVDLGANVLIYCT